MTDTDLQNKLLHELDMAQVKYEHEAAMADVELAKAQSQVNLAQAKNPSVFVSGARPFCLWVCTALMAVAVVAGIWAAYNPESRDAATAIAILFGSIVAPPMMLLLGARSYEKKQGVARDTHK